MKYSALVAVTLLVASSLGMSERSSRASTAAPGQIAITNNMNRLVHLSDSAGKNVILRQGQTISQVATKPSQDLVLSEQNSRRSQVEVSYTSGDRGTYSFVIRPVEGGGFPGAIEVLPLSPRPFPQCHPLTWYPGQGSTEQATCQDRTAFRVFLREAQHPSV
ncbi:hypothetical protein LLEC1_03021 [Akanthomyces lecanii]|uniref:Uncharacterized protein n=1 Tax=Cordyceps confragosa TaxID=2714763 RepID=A0A179I8P0_CORDF|nr:hypothetical protein LLEC1_03021 [Akanthomyces lecanii]